jgi:fumarylacetoacetate (FAA) hydrolase
MKLVTLKDGGRDGRLAVVSPDCNTAVFAGTIIGSGTVSNDNYRQIGSSCIAERRAIEQVDDGAPRTPYMSFADTVRMEAVGLQGETVFGVIDQRVVPYADRP